MTDLEKAIAEVAAHAPWHFQMLETSGDPSCDRAVVAILSAVVSGELIPTTDRDAEIARLREMLVEAASWLEGTGNSGPMGCAKTIRAELNKEPKP